MLPDHLFGINVQTQLEALGLTTQCSVVIQPAGGAPTSPQLRRGSGPRKSLTQLRTRVEGSSLLTGPAFYRHPSRMVGSLKLFWSSVRGISLTSGGNLRGKPATSVHLTSGMRLSASFQYSHTKHSTFLWSSPEMCPSLSVRKRCGDRAQELRSPLGLR